MFTSSAHHLPYDRRAPIAGPLRTASPSHFGGIDDGSSKSEECNMSAKWFVITVPEREMFATEEEAILRYEEHS